MQSPTWLKISAVALIAILYIVGHPFLFGAISELELPAWFVSQFESHESAHRFWADISWLIACLVIAIPGATSLTRLFGDRALVAAMVIGLASLTTFALLQLVPLAVPISSDLEIRAWVLNIAKAAAIPLLVVILRTSNKPFQPIAREDARSG